MADTDQGKGKEKPSRAKKDQSKVAGGKARASALSKDRRKAIAKTAAAVRWQQARPLKATHRGSFKADFGIDVDCYVLDDEAKTAVISQRDMGAALGFSGGSGGRLPAFIGTKLMEGYVGRELRKKLENPLVFEGFGPVANTKYHGYDVTMLIDLCKCIMEAEADGKLTSRYEDIARQAHVIVGASAKAGIKGLVYALSGYDQTREEVVAAFQRFVQEEARKYEKEFPAELYTEWHRLYEIPVPERGKPWHFKNLTVKHIYFPLAKSNGKILELVRALKSKDGDRQKKLFQFLNEMGARALRMQIGRVLEMTESSTTRTEYENKIAERFGGQTELDLSLPTSP